MSIRTYSAFGLLIALGLLPGCSSRPNVLLIVMDTVRQHNVSTYGYERVTTPHIDRFASDALVYDNAFAIGPWTTPNHASIFTGLYTAQHAANQEAEILGEQHITLAEALSAEGYTTAAFINNGTVSRRAGFAQGFQHFNAVWRKDFRAALRERHPVEGPDQGARHTAHAVRDFFESHPPSQPYFVFINYREAHIPYRPTARHLGDFAGGRQIFDDKITRYDYGRFLAGRYQMSDEDFAAAKALYDGEIRFLDEQIGALLTWLGSTGRLDDTLVIITSDHGEEFGEHDMVGHQFGLYDTVLRVPLIVRYPGDDPPTGRSPRRVQLTDLFPTVLEATGTPLPDSVPVRGQSLLGDGGHELLFAEFYRPIRLLRKFEREVPELDTAPYDRRLRSLRRGDHKLIWSSDGRHELYDLSRDPGELRNLAATEPVRLGQMAALLEGFIAELPGKVDTEGAALPHIGDDELRDNLRALGYGE